MGRGTLKPRDDLVNISLGRACVFLGLGPRGYLRGRGNRALAPFPYRREQRVVAVFLEFMRKGHGREEDSSATKAVIY